MCAKSWNNSYPSFQFSIHSSISFRQRNGTGTAEYNFEFWALHFAPKGILIPAVDNGTLKWSSEGVVTWAPTILNRVWTQQISLGFTNGIVLDHFMDWVLAWHKSHLYYQMFAAWNKLELTSDTKRYFEDTTCNTFTEGGLQELYRLGVRLSSEEVLCRTYVVFRTAGPLQAVGPFSLSDIEMRAYYGTLSTILDKFRDANVQKALEAIGVALAERRQPFAFVYDRDGKQYYKADLQKPYLSIWPMYLSQRMILPWQPVEEARHKECDPWGSSPQGTLVV